MSKGRQILPSIFVVNFNDNFIFAPQNGTRCYNSVDVFSCEKNKCLVQSYLDKRNNIQ
jgi:hypothetical protein